MTQSDLNRKDPYGRLLRREDIPKDSEHFILQEYSWLDFSAEQIVFTDNPRSSVIIKALHDPKELSEKVKVPGQFMKRFRKPIKPIFPIDLSDDYRKFMAESIQRRKRRNFDDDDSTTIDFSEISTPPDLEDRLSKWKSKVNKERETVATATASASPQQELEINSEISRSVPDFVKDEKQTHSLARDAGNNDFESRSASGLANSPKGTAVPPAGVGMRPASDISQAARDRILAQLNAKTGLLEESFQESDRPSNEITEPSVKDFNPENVEQKLNPSMPGGAHFGSAHEFVSEDSPVPSTHSNVLEEQPNQNGEARAAELDEAFNRGYGQAVEKFAELHTALQSAAQQINGLKEQMLHEGRDIFIEVLNLTAEEVIRKKLNLSTDALSRLFQSAVGNLNKGGPLRVRANAVTIERLKELYADSKLPFDSIEWQSDDSLQMGDLKLQTSHEAAKVDLKAIVANKVRSLAGEIFSQDAGQSDAHDDETESNEQSLAEHDEVS